MFLLHQANPQIRSGVLCAQRQIAQHASAIDAATDNQYVQRGFAKRCDLAGTQIEHSVASLKHPVSGAHLSVPLPAFAIQSEPQQTHCGEWNKWRD